MTTKITVSLSDDLVAAAKAAVAGGRGTSVSALVADALRAHLGDNTLHGLVADMIAEHGEPTPADVAWAREAIGLSAQDRGERAVGG